MQVIKIGVTAGDLRLMDISHELKSLQRHVGGYIEPCAPVELVERGIQLLANEEGLLKRLPPNENLFPFFFVGDVLAVGVNDEDFCSLTDQQVLFMWKWIHDLRY